MGLTDGISLALSSGALMVAVGSWVLTAAGLVASYLIAKHYGDLAAVEASQALHEQEMARARAVALGSLLNEVKRAARIRERNSGILPGSFGQPVTRLPVAAFETAFSSGAPGITGGEALLDWVAEYLAQADEVNSQVDLYVAAAAGSEQVNFRLARGAMGEVRNRCRDELPRVLYSLRACLRQELGLPAAGDS